MSNIFELASRQQLRFTSVRGDLTTEQLWDLPLTSKTGVSLDGLAIAISRQLKESATESFVSEVTSGNKILELKLEILKHVIKYKQEVNAAKISREETATKRRALEAALERKQAEKIDSASEEELQAQLAALNAKEVVA